MGKAWEMCWQIAREAWILVENYSSALCGPTEYVQSWQVIYWNEILQAIYYYNKNARKIIHVSS